MRRATFVALLGAAFYAGLAIGVRRTLSLAPHEFLAYKARYESDGREGRPNQR